MSEELNLALLIGATVLLVSVVAVRFSSRLGLPTLLVYLALGVGIGEAGLGIKFSDAELTRTIAMCALVVIIAEGGLTIRWSTLRTAIGPAITLATVGVVASVVVIAAVAHLTLGLDWRLALLYGAVLSPTDAAAVFSTLRRFRLPPRLTATLEAESGMNDAPVILIVMALSVSPTGSGPVWYQLLLVLYQLAGAAVIGYLVGRAGAWAMPRAALPAAGLYPLAVVGLTILAYAAAAYAETSGFLAVYVSGVVLGNARLPHRRAMLGFADGLAWLAQIGLFVLLGLLVAPSELGSAVLPALAVGIGLVLLARPISVMLSVTLFRFGAGEQVFLSWAGLRGAVPVVLATIPLSEGVPGAHQLFNVVFVLSVIFTAVQGTTLPAVARVLRVAAPAEPEELPVETAPLERMRADLLQVEVPRGSRLAGVHLDELRLPQGAAVTLVLRDEAGFVPSAQTRLKIGDSLLIVATSESRDATEYRLRAVNKSGRLARWLAERDES